MVILKGDLRQILSLRVRIARKRMRLEKRKGNPQWDAVEATMLGLKTKSGLRPYSRYKTSFIYYGGSYL